MLCPSHNICPALPQVPNPEESMEVPASKRELAWYEVKSKTPLEQFVKTTEQTILLRVSTVFLSVWAGVGSNGVL